MMRVRRHGNSSDTSPNSACWARILPAPATTSGPGTTIGKPESGQNHGQAWRDGVHVKVVFFLQCALVRFVRRAYLCFVMVLENGIPGVVAARRFLVRHSGTPRARVDLPVILVPGFANSPRVFRDWVRMLREDGCDVHVHENPKRGCHDLMEGARALAARIEAILEATGASAVHVVGYSAGGVVARACAELLEGAERINSLTLIATPHTGVGWLRPLVALGQRAVELELGAVAQLLPNSPILAELAAAGPVEGIRYTSIYARGFDGMVNSKSAQLAGAANIEISHPVPGVVNHMSFVHWTFGAYRAALEALQHAGDSQSPRIALGNAGTPGAAGALQGGGLV